jgi:hypothetical protein
MQIQKRYGEYPESSLLEKMKNLVNFGGLTIVAVILLLIMVRLEQMESMK